MFPRHAISDDHWDRIKDFLPGQKGDPKAIRLESLTYGKLTHYRNSHWTTELMTKPV